MIMTIVLLGAVTLTSDGVYVRRTISDSEARNLVAKYGIISCVEHGGTAMLASEVLGCSVPTNKGVFVHQVNQMALCCRITTLRPGALRLRLGEMPNRWRDRYDHEFVLITRVS
jgi:hypothetical protein